MTRGQGGKVILNKDETVLFEAQWRDVHFTLGDMADFFGVSRKTVYRIAKESGLGLKIDTVRRGRKDEMPKQTDAWPDDMPSFEDHPDAGTAKDYGMRGDKPQRHTTEHGGASSLVNF